MNQRRRQQKKDTKSVLAAEKKLTQIVADAVCRSTNTLTKIIHSSQWDAIATMQNESAKTPWEDVRTWLDKAKGELWFVDFTEDDFYSRVDSLVSEAIRRDREELKKKIESKKIFIEQQQVGCLKCDSWRERVSHNSEGFFCSGCGKKETTRTERLNGDFEHNELIDSILSLLDNYKTI